MTCYINILSTDTLHYIHHFLNDVDFLYLNKHIYTQLHKRMCNKIHDVCNKIHTYDYMIVPFKYYSKNNLSMYVILKNITTEEKMIKDTEIAYVKKWNIYYANIPVNWLYYYSRDVFLYRNIENMKYIRLSGDMIIGNLSNVFATNLKRFGFECGDQTHGCSLRAFKQLERLEIDTTQHIFLSIPRSLKCITANTTLHLGVNTLEHQITCNVPYNMYLNTGSGSPSLRKLIAQCKHHYWHGY